MSVIIKNINKKYGDFVAVNDISFQVKEGEFLALLGPSGSGKTTLLRIIAGLELPDTGEIYLEGIDAQNKPVRERKIGFVFQHFALFKHLSVFDNIAFGLRLKRPKLTKQEIYLRVDNLLKLVHLAGVGGKYPSELSGGQRQRVALARVLAIEPKYMLLDEPFGALDSKVRKELRRWLKKLHDTIGLTTIFVTHDQEEAIEIADRIAILNDGKLVQLATPLELWESPANVFVYDFLGNYNIFKGYEIEDGKLLFSKPSSQAHMTQVYSRPYEIGIERTPSDPRFFQQATLTLINKAGPLIKLEFEGKEETFYLAEIEKSILETMNFKIGEELWLKPLRYCQFKKSTVLSE